MTHIFNLIGYACVQCLNNDPDHCMYIRTEVKARPRDGRWLCLDCATKANLDWNKLPETPEYRACHD